MNKVRADFDEAKNNVTEQITVPCAWFKKPRIQVDLVMQVFEVLASFETREVPEGVLNEILTPDGVFLVIDDTHNKVWYFSGPRAPLERQVLGKFLANEYRGQLKLFYKVEDAAGLNENQFNAILEKTVTPGKCTEIRVAPEEVEDDAALEPASYQDLAIEAMTAQTKARDPCVHHGVIRQVALEKIQGVLEERHLPPEYEQDFVLCQDAIYVQRQNLENFVTTRQETTTLEEMGRLQDGVFFLPNRSCRVISGNGRVMGLEFLVRRDEFEEVSLDVPVFFEDRFLYQRDVQLLQRAFHIAEEPPIVDEEGELAAKESPE